MIEQVTGASAVREKITATVKWFNTVKGFGFVAPAGGLPDAFLHISVLHNAGLQAVAEGATIVCDIADGQKGLQVAAILDVDNTTAGEAVAESEPTGKIDGTVKFFNEERGFGFIIPDDGGKEIFVGSRALEQCGLSVLEPGQKVRAVVRFGKKGPMAEKVDMV